MLYIVNKSYIYIYICIYMYSSCCFDYYDSDLWVLGCRADERVAAISGFAF